jgi:hypothetical protein
VKQSSPKAAVPAAKPAPAAQSDSDDFDFDEPEDVSVSPTKPSGTSSIVSDVASERANSQRDTSLPVVDEEEEEEEQASATLGDDFQPPSVGRSTSPVSLRSPSGSDTFSDLSRNSPSPVKPAAKPSPIAGRLLTGKTQSPVASPVSAKSNTLDDDLDNWEDEPLSDSAPKPAAKSPSPTKASPASSPRAEVLVSVSDDDDWDQTPAAPAPIKDRFAPIPMDPPGTVHPASPTVSDDDVIIVIDDDPPPSGTSTGDQDVPIGEDFDSADDVSL